MNTAARRRLVRKLLVEEPISSQSQLVRLLQEQAFEVTQATVSRDLHALGAIKAYDGRRLRYMLPDDNLPTGEAITSLGRTLSEFAASIAYSHNLVVIKTSSGAAHVVAAAIDAAPLEGLIGTIAGDDTLLVIAGEMVGGRDLADMLEKIGAG